MKDGKTTRGSTSRRKRPLKIILIDDSEWNHSPQALAGIRQHQLVTFQDVEAAHRYLSQLETGDVDVLLTDLWMPTQAPEGDTHYAREATDRHAGVDIPSGLAFALRIAAFGIPVAISTDGHHHSDRLIRLAHQSVATPVWGAGLVLVLEAFQFSVPGIRWVPKLRRIMRVREMDPAAGEPRRFELFELADTELSHPIGQEEEKKVRLVKDWGAVLDMRLRSPLRPPNYKKRPCVPIWPPRPKGDASRTTQS